MKKNLFSMPIVATVVMVNVFCSSGNKGNAGQDQTGTDSVAVKTTEFDQVAAKAFLENMYKDFFEPWNEDREDKVYLSKFFTSEAMRKFYVESDYEEGEFFYCTDFLVHGDLSGSASPDYGNKVVSRTIEPESDGWFLVTNIWDVIKEPVKVRLQVKNVNGSYKVVDISADNNSLLTMKTVIDLYKSKNKKHIQQVLVENGYSLFKSESNAEYWTKNASLKAVKTNDGNTVYDPIVKRGGSVCIFGNEDISISVSVYSDEDFNKWEEQVRELGYKEGQYGDDLREVDGWTALGAYGNLCKLFEDSKGNSIEFMKNGDGHPGYEIYDIYTVSEGK